MWLGVDGGGTKTEFVLFGDDMRAQARFRMGTCHPAQVGFEGMRALLAEGVEAARAHGLQRRCFRLVVADHGHLHDGARGEIVLQMLLQRVHGILVDHAVDVRLLEQLGAVVVVGTRARHAVEAVDAQLYGGVHVDGHVGVGLPCPRNAADAERHKNEAGGKGCDERRAAMPARGAARGLAVDDGKRWLLGVGEAVRGSIRCPRLPLLLNPRERALGEAGGHMHPIEGLMHPLFKLVGHCRASLSCFLPREIHEYTVPSGMPVI